MMLVLATQEELVLHLRFGRAREAQTRAQVARLLGVSNAAVQRIERRALRTLRQNALGPLSSGWQGWDEV